MTQQMKPTARRRCPSRARTTCAITGVVVTVLIVAAGVALAISNPSDNTAAGVAGLCKVSVSMQTVSMPYSRPDHGQHLPTLQVHVAKGLIHTSIGHHNVHALLLNLYTGAWLANIHQLWLVLQRRAVAAVHSTFGGRAARIAAPIAQERFRAAWGTFCRGRSTWPRHECENQHRI